MAQFKIGNRLIGDDYQPIVMAEIGINHEGSLDLAISMADAAIQSGAEIIKHQTHIVDDEMSSEARNVIPGNADVSIYKIMERCSLSEAEERQFMNHVISKGSIFISTPFSKAAVDRLVDFNVPAFKVGSGECSNYPLIKYIASKGRPIILSTGMNSIETVRPSVEIFRKAGIPFALLHCTNVYPTPPELVRLGSLTQLKKIFPDAVVGLSDHTTSNYPSLGAVALGGSIIERHFTDRMDRPGPDILCSMDPKALANLIEGANIIFLARGGDKGPVKQEMPTIAFAFSSLVAIEDIDAGEALTEHNIWLKRPGGGDFGPSDYDLILGRKTLRPIKKGFQIKKIDIDNI